MNTVNITDNNNNVITVSAETGEVLDNIRTGADIIRAAEPKSVSEEENTLFFEAKQWTVSKDCDKTVGSRTFITDHFGNLSEAWLLGDWNWNWSQIETKDMILQKNTDYVFTFWLNGGENDCNNSLCQLEIVFDNDYESRSVYRLDRSYIQYTKHYKGWYLFRIPFNTGDAAYTKLRFVALRAYCAILPAKELSAYDNLPEDLPQANVPQRHNIVFGKDGFPRDSWWSHYVFGDNGDNNNRNNSEKNNTTHVHINGRFGGPEDWSDFGENIRRKVLEDIDFDSIMDNIADEIMDEFDEDDIASQILGEIDVDSIKEQIKNSIRNNLGK